jgi:hypothetical protein
MPAWVAKRPVREARPRNARAPCYFVAARNALAYAALDLGTVRFVLGTADAGDGAAEARTAPLTWEELLEAVLSDHDCELWPDSGASNATSRAVTWQGRANLQNARALRAIRDSTPAP